MCKLFPICIFLLMSIVDNNKSEFTYEPGEWETMVVDLITREASNLPLHDFVDDPQLIQKVDRFNKLSLYIREVNKGQDGVDAEVKGQDIRMEEEEANVVYRRKQVDKNLPIVVLRSAEDHLKVFYRKRTFVVLRQNPLAKNKYFSSYVYLRFWTDKQPNCTSTYLNDNICVEWDTWDNDRGEVKTKVKYFGWTDCASSFLFSCPPPNNNSQLNATTTLAERGIRNTTLSYQAQTDTKLSFLPSEALPFDDTIDAFWDLETNMGEGHYIRETIRHSSIFNKPQSFVIKQTLGRSFGSQDEKSIQEKLKEVKDKAKIQGRNLSKKKYILRQNLENRSGWLERKNDLNSLIRTYAKQLGFPQFYKIKKDPEKLKKLKSFKNASEILQELELLGEHFEMNEVIRSEEKEKGSEVTVLREADLQEHGHWQGISVGPEENNLVASFGRAISEIVVKTGGGGMSGRAIGQLDSHVSQTIAKSVLFSSTDLFQNPGWKLQGLESDFKVNSTFEHEHSIFYGLGSCPFKKPELNYPEIQPGNQAQVVEFFLTVLRTYCLKDAREYLHYLLKEKYLVVYLDHFMIPVHLFQSKKLKLQTNEFRKLSASLELASFSRNYGEELKHSWATLESSGGISRSVHYLIEFAFNFLAQARLVADQHFIKLARNLLLTLRGVLTKLIQDYEIINTKCDLKSCRWDIEGNYNDRYAIHSFIQFLSRGMAPIEKNKNAAIEPIFKQFVNLNTNAIKQGLNFYN